MQLSSKELEVTRRALVVYEARLSLTMAAGENPKDSDRLEDLPILSKLIGEIAYRPESTPETQRLIREHCGALAEFLVQKNKSYGDSALDPVAVMTRGLGFDTRRERSLAGLRFKIDDKLSRLSRGTTFEGDSDDVLDLIGYLILFRIAARDLEDEA